MENNLPKKNTVVALLRCGLSIPQLADHIGVARKECRKMIKDMDIEYLVGAYEMPTKKEITELYEGRTIRTTAEAMDVPVKRAYFWLKWHEVPMKINRSRRTEIPKKTLKKLYVAEGYTAKQIAEELGVSVATVWNRLNEYGLTKTARERARIERKRGEK